VSRLFLLSFICTSAAAQDCPLNTTEPGVVARISNTRSAIELQKNDTIECVISLDCKVREGAVKGIDYELATLVAPKVAPKFHQVRRVTLNFTEGTAQTCAALSVLQPPKGMKIDPLPPTTPTTPTPPPAAAPMKPEPSAE
jgi:hypothetical protein